MQSPFKVFKKHLSWILREIFLEPFTIRRFSIFFIKYFKIGSYEARLSYGAVDRPHYGYCIKQAVRLAINLGYDRISVLEFGVAGGRGILYLEYHVKEIEKIYNIKIDIYGFDTGYGLPEPKGYRDLPYIWKKGFFEINLYRLNQRIERTQLILGEISETISSFFEEYNPAPIGAMFYDMDYYSSTSSSLKIFNNDEKYFLPRIFSYFDDTIGDETSLYNEYTGERLAINEFNMNKTDIKIAKPHYFHHKSFSQKWYYQIWLIHLFKHKDYNKYISFDNKQMNLRM